MIILQKKRKNTYYSLDPLLRTYPLTSRFLWCHITTFKIYRVSVTKSCLAESCYFLRLELKIRKWNKTFNNVLCFLKCNKFTPNVGPFMKHLFREGNYTFLSTQRTCLLTEFIPFHSPWTMSTFTNL